MKFGLKIVFLRKLEIRKNILLNILGIHQRARFKVLLNATRNKEQIINIDIKRQIFSI